MKILTRNILFRFIGSFFVFFILFTSLFILLELFELKDSHSIKTENFGLLAKYFAIRLPFLAYASSPVAVILGTIFVVASRAHLSEIVAAQAGGISVFTYIRPIVFASIALAVLLLAGTEWKIPEWSDRADYIRRVEIQKKVPPKAEFRDLAFAEPNFPSSDLFYVMAERFVPADGRLDSVTVIIPNRSHTEADTVVTFSLLRYDFGGAGSSGRPGASTLRGWTDGVLSIDDFDRIIHLPAPKIIEIIAGSGSVMLLAEKPIEAVRISTLIHEIVDLKSLAGPGSEQFGKIGQEIAERTVKIHAKLAFPFSVPFLAILAGGLGARIGRRKGIGAAVGSAMLCTIGYMALLQTSTRLGDLAAHSPAVSDYAPLIPWLVPLAIGSLAVRSLIPQR